MENISDLLKVDLSNLFHRSTVSMLGHFGIGDKSEINLSILELLKKCEESNEQTLKFFAKRLREDGSEIFSMVESLGHDELERLSSLLLYYNESLSRLSDYEDEEKEEFYLSLTFNIIRDIENYICEVDELKKPECCQTSMGINNEVADLATSFSLY